MEDRYKYRVWQKIKKGSSFLWVFSEFSDYQAINLTDYMYRPDCFIEQCICLKDSLGHLIYEGDILAIEYYDDLWEVRYSESEGRYVLDNHKGHVSGISNFTWSWFTVVGNIHENAYLLEDESK